MMPDTSSATNIKKHIFYKNTKFRQWPPVFLKFVNFTVDIALCANANIQHGHAHFHSILRTATNESTEDPSMKVIPINNQKMAEPNQAKTMATTSNAAEEDLAKAHLASLEKQVEEGK